MHCGLRIPEEEVFCSWRCQCEWQAKEIDTAEKEIDANNHTYLD